MRVLEACDVRVELKPCRSTLCSQLNMKDIMFTFLTEELRVDSCTRGLTFGTLLGRGTSCWKLNTKAWR